MQQEPTMFPNPTSAGPPPYPALFGKPAQAPATEKPPPQYPALFGQPPVGQVNPTASENMSQSRKNLQNTASTTTTQQSNLFGKASTATSDSQAGKGGGQEACEARGMEGP